MAFGAAIDWGDCIIAEIDIENKMENEIVSTSKANDAREGEGRKTGNAEKAAQPPSTCTSQDRKVQKGESKLTIQITKNHNIYVQNIQFSLLQ